MFLSGNSFLMTSPPTDYVLVCINRPGYFGSDSVGGIPTIRLPLMWNNARITRPRHSWWLGIPVEDLVPLACRSSPHRVQAVGILSGIRSMPILKSQQKRCNAFLLGLPLAIAIDGTAGFKELGLRFS
jgi:hypothetical protein